MRVFFCIHFVFILSIYLVDSAPQQSPEINDQFEKLNHTEVEIEDVKHVESTAVVQDDRIVETEKPVLQTTESTAIVENLKPGFMTKFYIALQKPIAKFVAIPKISTVLQNVGTCIVNGAMEIVAFLFPAPMIPLIATAAGMVIPFEPVITLRKRMPVTSYRRAFRTAVNSFMGTFDKYKEVDDDPYMTRRFNRRFMRDNNDNE